MPAWSGARPDKLSGLPTQKGGLSWVAWRAPCPSDTMACPSKVVVQKRWAEPGTLEDSCPSYAQARPTKS
jgi:hypothetical protein